MRGTASLAIVGAAAAVVVSIASAGATPVVQVTALSPVAVRGTGFRPGERLTVVLMLGGRETRAVRASRRGSFFVRFREYADLCTAYTLRVLGGQQVRAAVRHRAPSSCAALDPVP